MDNSEKRSALAFVVQQHCEGGACHWDLMLERPDCSKGDDDRVLATWSFVEKPLALSFNQTIHAQELPDHRRIYLHYEGPIQNGKRGECKIVDSGTYDLLEVSDKLWRVVFAGEKLIGRFLLQKKSTSAQWTLTKE